MSLNATESTIFALLAGFDKAAGELNVSENTVRQTLQNLAQSKTKFFAKLRCLILEKGMKENTKVASKYFGIAEYMIIDMLRKYLSEEASAPGNTIFPYNTYDRFTQTCELPSKHWMHVASQTDLPYKLPKKSYTSLEKIQELRKPSNLVSSSLTDKWKDKIKNSLFQATHIQMYSEGKKDKFFNDIDNILVDFYKEFHPSDDNLIKKCLEIVNFEDSNIKVTEDWLKEFKKHYHLG